MIASAGKSPALTKSQKRNRLGVRLAGGLIALCLAQLGMVGCSGTKAGTGTGSAVPTTPAALAPSSTVAAYHVVGNKVVGADGRQFIPYGFVNYCLAHLSSSGCVPATTGGPNPDRDRISEAATFWHANVVRIQAAQEYMFRQSPVDSSYLAELDGQVNLASSLGMIAIVTLQEQPFDGPPLPDASSMRFWQFMANHYKNNPAVFFDLYNQPHLKTYQGEDWMWRIWRDGGAVDTSGPPPVHDTFVGMQTLVDAIRAAGANNIIVAEGNKTGHDLSGIPKYALSGSNVTYGMDPTLGPTDQTPAQWAANWGDLSDSVPVMMEAFQDWPGANNCNPDTPTLLPQLLNYLHSKNLGMIVWSLNGGNIIVGSDLEKPTWYQGATRQPCVNDKTSQHPPVGNETSSSTQAPDTIGPGTLILEFFRANNPR